MTTICYRDNVLAADRLLTDGNRIAGRKKKIEKISEFQYVAFCGSLFDFELLLSWARCGATPENFPVSVGPTQYVVVSDSVPYRYDGRGVSVKYAVGSYLVLGTGAQFAEGAIISGANAVQACQAACKLDVYSGSGIDWVDCRTGETGYLEPEGQ